MDSQDKKKIIIYDSSKGFYRFIKLNFSEIYEVDSFLDFKDPKEINFNNYSAAFFIINESVEIFDLMLIYSKGMSVFVGSRLSEINKSLQNIEDITIIDLTQSKHDMIDFISFHLKIFAVEE